MTKQEQKLRKIIKEEIRKELGETYKDWTGAIHDTSLDKFGNYKDDFINVVENVENPSTLLIAIANYLVRNIQENPNEFMYPAQAKYSAKKMSEIIKKAANDIRIYYQTYKK